MTPSKIFAFSAFSKLHGKTADCWTPLSWQFLQAGRDFEQKNSEVNFLRAVSDFSTKFWTDPRFKSEVLAE